MRATVIAMLKQVSSRGYINANVSCRKCGTRLEHMHDVVIDDVIRHWWCV